jgi:hypothetical protein
MALVLDETFANSIPANFATARAQSGALTASYNAAAQAVDLSNSAAGQNIWDITSVTPLLAGEIEVDLEWVADLSGASDYRHAGLWGVAGQAVSSNGFRFAHYQSDWRLGRWDGTQWAGNSAETIAPQGTADMFNAAGNRRTLNLRWDFGQGAGVSRLAVEARVDGIVRLVNTTTFASLRPGIFVYQSTVRLHSIKVWDLPQTALGALGFRGLRPTEGRGVLTPAEAANSGLSHARHVSSLGLLESPVPNARLSHPHYIGRGQTLAQRNVHLGGNGKLTGTVAVKGSPNIPVQRRVRLFDERTGLLVREVFSDPVTGAYEFLYIGTEHPYTVVAYDYANNYRAVLADNISAEFLA